MDYSAIIVSCRTMLYTASSVSHSAHVLYPHRKKVNTQGAVYLPGSLVVLHFMKKLLIKKACCDT